MPLLSYENDPALNQVGALDLRPPKEEAAVALGQVAGAAWRQENMIGSAVNNKLTGIDLSRQEDGYTGEDVWNGIKATKYEQYWDRFAKVHNREAFAAMQAQIDMEQEDRRTIAAGGWVGLGATFGASIVDPTMLIPGGAVVKTGRAGLRTLKSALAVGTAAAAGAAVQEAGLQATQQTRPISESLTAIAGGAILGGLLGAGASRVFSAAEAGRVARILDDAQEPGFDAATAVLHRELSDIATGNRSIGAAQTAVDTLDDLSIAGRSASKVAEKTAFMNPMLRTLTSPSRAVRAVAAGLMDAPVYLKKNLRGEGETAAETAMLEYTRGAVARAVEVQREAFSEARKAGLSMSEKQFRDAVGKAMRRSDRSDIPAVEKAAKAWRSTVIEPLKDRAIKAKMLPEDVSPKTAESYLSRIYDQPKIVAREHEFKRIIRDWLSGEIDRAALREKRAADAKVMNLQREANDIEMRMARRQTALEERMQRGEVGTDDFSEAEIVELMRRVTSGETPKMPQTLSKWVRTLRRDGIYDRNGDLAAAYPALRNMPGLLRKSRKGTHNPKGGLGLDDVVLRAWEEGFLNDAATVPHGAGREALVSERPSIREFLDALDRDLRGEPVVRIEDLDEARAVADFEQIMDAMERVGVDFDKARFATSDAMRNVASAVNRTLDDLDRVKIASLNDAMSEVNQRGQYDFISDADRADVLDRMTDEVFDKITGRDLDGKLPIDMKIEARGPLKERTLNIPDERIEDFLVSDAELIGRRYARLMAGDIELTERYGSPSMEGAVDEIRTDYAAMRKRVEANPDLAAEQKEGELQRLAGREAADIRDIEGVRDIIRGHYKQEQQHTNFARVLRGANAFNYIRALGGVAISSLSDVVRPAMVHGLKAYMGDGLKPLIANLPAFKMSVKEAKLAGAVTERILANRLATLAEINDPYSLSSPFEKFLENSSVGFSKMTGILHWNDFQKSIASVMTQNRILENAEKAAAKGFDSLPKKERAYMGFLGLNEARTEELGKLFATYGDNLEGVRVANTEKWGDEGELLKRAYRAAVNKDVDSIIVTKSAGDTPLFSHTPLGRTLLQFRSFAMASNQRVLIRGLQEDKARFIGGMIGMTALGMLTYYLKQIESGREVSDNPGVWISEGLDRSGIFSLAFEVNNTFEKLGGPGLYTAMAAAGQAAFPGSDGRQPASRYATRTAFSGLMGPTFDLGERSSRVGAIGFRAMNGNLDLTGGDVGDIRRLTPFASLPYWRWFIDGMLVPELKGAVQ